DSAWATGSPTGNVQVKALTNTNIDDGAILALVIKSSGVTSQAYATLGMVGQQTLPGGADFNADGSLVAGGAIYSAVASFNGAGTLRANDRFVSGKYDETGEIASLGFTGDRLTELEFGLDLDVDNLYQGDVLRFRVYLNAVALDVYS